MRAGVATVTEPPAVTASDEALIGSVLAGQLEAFALLMRRYNQRVYRVARAILRDPVEAEDAVQHTYLFAFANLHQFAGNAAFCTWLTRIAIRAAVTRLHALRRARALKQGELVPAWCKGETAAGSRSPEDHASRAELVRMLEHALDALPEAYRAILVLRELEGLSTKQAAQCLSISEQAVRVRLHRARTLLRHTLWERAGEAACEVFGIGGQRCTSIVARVLATLAARR